jgi:hypothetical protein
MGVPKMFNFFSEFDLLGGLYQEIKGTFYWFKSGEQGTHLEVDNPDIAAKMLRDEGLKVVSITRGYNTSLITVPTAQEGLARLILGL